MYKRLLLIRLGKVLLLFNTEGISPLYKAPNSLAKKFNFDDSLFYCQHCQSLLYFPSIYHSYTFSTSTMLQCTKIKKLNSEEITLFEEVITLFADVFEMKEFVLPKREYLRGLLEKDSFHVFVALQEEAVIGGLTAYTLHQYYSEKPLAYLFDLAVAKRYQRQGFGTALMRKVKSYFQNLGYAEVFVQADREEDYAVTFYRKTQPSEEEDVLHFYYSFP